MSEDNKKKETADRVRRTREERGMTQAVMAERAGLSFENLKKIEDGTNGMSMPSLRKVQEALGTTFDYLLDGKRKSLEELEREVNNCSHEEQIYLLLKLFKSVSRTAYSEVEIYHLLGEDEQEKK